MFIMDLVHKVNSSSKSISNIYKCLFHYIEHILMDTYYFLGKKEESLSVRIVYKNINGILFHNYP